MVDGHELSILGTMGSLYGVVHGIYGKGWIRRMIHQEPILAMSVAMFCGAIALPLTIIPIRRAIGLPTNQYDPHHPNVVFPKLIE